MRVPAVRGGGRPPGRGKDPPGGGGPTRPRAGDPAGPGGQGGSAAPPPAPTVRADHRRSTVMHRVTRRIGDASARRPWATIGMWAVAAAIVLGLAGTAGGSFTDDLVAPSSQSEEAMVLLEERFPEAAGTVSPDGRVGFAEIAFDRPATELGPAPLTAVADAIAPARAAGVAAELGGDAAFINAETETSGAEAAGLLAALVVLVVAFGTIGAALLPIALTVVAMAALVLTGLGFLASIGLSTSLVVLFAVATALTLLPALLTLLGDRVDAGRLIGRRRPTRRAQDTGWWRFAHRVSGRPWPYLIAAVAVLLALAAPALGMKMGWPDAGDDSTAATHRRAYDLLADGFGPGFNAPLLLVADLRRQGVDAAAVPDLSERVAADPGIAMVGQPRTSPAGDTVVLPTIPTTAPADPETSATLGRVRDLVPANVAVSGLTAMTDDLTNQLSATLPIFIGAILAASFLLLMVVFRSVAVPLKAAVMNLLSIGGAYGVVVAVFQWGWLADLFGLEGTYLIASPMPTIFFAVLFGLSMDYEVFLLSRIREAYDATGDNAESVARGAAATGRVITSAALIMTVVFASFVADPSPLVKMLGLGLSTAIVLDATIVRMVVVPATMGLLGRANWWLPGWLDRRLPQLRPEGAGVLQAPAA